ncbi:YqaE/Pmp3 family membrane protein [Serratia sp. T13T92]|uniref:YqaE/Pmp3 family membrane protein n=1 Tax=Serratia sp. T13T92 TaxID=3397496 RepID=UPI0039E0B68C
MRLLLAVLLPWLAFFTIKKPFQGILCLLLQITLIGWIPAAMWAIFSVNDYHAEKRTKQIQQQIIQQQEQDQ